MTAITLKEAPHRQGRYESEMRYEVFLHGEFFDELYFNLRGYVGYLPTPDGRKLDIGEKSISAYRKEIATLNREFKEK